MDDDDITQLTYEELKADCDAYRDAYYELGYVGIDIVYKMQMLQLQHIVDNTFNILIGFPAFILGVYVGAILLNPIMM